MSGNVRFPPIAVPRALRHSAAVNSERAIKRAAIARAIGLALGALFLALTLGRVLNDWLIEGQPYEALKDALAIIISGAVLYLADRRMSDFRPR